MKILYEIIFYISKWLSYRIMLRDNKVESVYWILKLCV